MKKLFFKIIILLVTEYCQAQNLVPNPSFEDSTNCPYYWPPNSATPWFNANIATPDYFTNDTSICGYHWINGQFSGQTTGIGHQLPRTGNAYSGFYVQLTPTREYIETKLNDTLIAGQTYLVSFYVSRAESFNLAADKIGAYFSDTAIVVNDYHHIQVIPQVENTNGNIISDTTNWVNIQGTFIANGTETYLIIGNFRDDALTLVDTIITNSPNGYGAYYFIDDVSVSIVTGIEENSENNSANIYPSPFVNSLNIKTKSSELKEIIIYDLTSKQIIHQKFENSITLNTENLTSGIYFYELRNNYRIIKQGRIMKN